MPENNSPPASEIASAPANGPDRQIEPRAMDEEARVFALWGAEPEIIAYAMARYSRSALSLRESLREIDRQKAEKFLNTFYFQYGHRSIADLAHLGFAMERLSLLAAIAVADESRWDGQERSTRYQNFRAGDWYVPAALSAPQRVEYEAALGRLFAAYYAITEKVWRLYGEKTPCPAGMERERFERALRARAYDVARYLLPLATLTSLGQIVSARTLESQIARLLSSEQAEVRELGHALKRAAGSAAHDPRRERLQAAAAALENCGQPALAAEMAELARPAAALPTLVKYADANPYQIASRRDLRQLARELLGGVEPRPSPRVTLLEPRGFEIELAATLLYAACDLPYAQIEEVVSGLDARRREEIFEVGMRSRGEHDELAREWCSGYAFQFDILMDLGGFRDLHRHRRCVQIHQPATFRHGYETPSPIRECGAEADYHAALELARQTAAGLNEAAPYLISLAYRKRTLFKMDAAEAVYIIELRTAAGGHFSYRQTAWEMYEALRARHPGLASRLRVRRPDPERELAQR